MQTEGFERNRRDRSNLAHEGRPYTTASPRVRAKKKPILSTLNTSSVALSLSKKESQSLVSVVYVAGLILLYVIGSSGTSFESQLGAALICTLALAPTVLWARLPNRGLPIYPICAATFVLTFALPLVTGHVQTAFYTPAEHLAAATKVSFLLTIANIAWVYCMGAPQKPPRKIRALSTELICFHMIAIYTIATLYHVMASAGLLHLLPPKFLSVVRAFVLGLNSAAIFFLAFTHGQRRLSIGYKSWFFLLFPIFLLASGAQLFLTGPARSSVVALTGFVLARRKIPWKTLIFSLCLLSILHAGKHDMRDVYWDKFTRPVVALVDYPAWYFEWLSKGVSELNEKLTERSSESDQTANERLVDISITSRVSLMHLLLMLQWRVGTDVDYLHGKTYSVLPKMVIPRALLKSKPSTHHGNNTISQHLQMQTADAFSRHTIGWGIVNEAYANFGLLGMALLGALLGWGLGAFTRLASLAPITSNRFFFSGAVLSSMLQTEWTLSTFAATLSQVFAVLWVYDRAVMRTWTQVSARSRVMLERLRVAKDRALSPQSRHGSFAPSGQQQPHIRPLDRVIEALKASAQAIEEIATSVGVEATATDCQFKNFFSPNRTQQLKRIIFFALELSSYLLEFFVRALPVRAPPIALYLLNIANIQQ